VLPYEFRDPASVQARPDGSLMHPKLQLHDGYTCRLCRYRTINPFIVSRHLSKEHPNGSRQSSRSEIDDLYDDVYLQTWTHYAHGAEQQYWVVEKNGSLTRPVAGRDACAHLQSMHERERRRLESEKQASSYGQDTGPQTLAATRPWIERTEWATTYGGVRRDFYRLLLSCLALLPTRLTTS
jgi:hypothetical protein